MMKLIIFVGFLAVALGDVSHLFKRPPIAILRYLNEVYPDGSYEYGYDTENGISAQERGQPINQGGTAAQGFFQYTSPEGVPVQIQYQADENGFQPSGNVLPTPPPTPTAILRALQYIASHPNQRYQ